MVVIELPIWGALDTVIMILKNKIWHFINYPQIKKFAHINNRDIIIFLAEYYWKKKIAVI